MGAYYTFRKVKPPLRSEADRAAMVEGVASGAIDVIVSSHEPQGADTKRQTFASAAFGAVGLETLLPAALNLYHDEQASLVHILAAVTATPARLLGLAAGTLAKGAPADLGAAGHRRTLRSGRTHAAFARPQHRLRGPQIPGPRPDDLRRRRMRFFRAASGRLPADRFAAESSLSSRAMIGPIPLPFVLEALVLGYLLGSIPFGLFFAFASGAGDVRKIGSGNIGATNVLRTGKKWAAAATLLFDGLKGAAAVLIAWEFLPPGCEIFAALAAMLGHIFPVWLRFKGGKGVATFLGVTAWRFIGRRDCWRRRPGWWRR